MIDKYWTARDGVLRLDVGRMIEDGHFDRQIKAAEALQRKTTQQKETTEETSARLAAIMSDKSTQALGRFGHHPNAATDFEVEVQSLEGRLFDAQHGISKPGTQPETAATVLTAIQRAMTFRVGGDESCVRAKATLRELEAKATPQPSDPADAELPKEWRAVIEDLLNAHPHNALDHDYVRDEATCPVCKRHKKVRAMLAKATPAHAQRQDAQPAAPSAQAATGWIVVKEHAWDHDDSDRSTLAYLWPSEFERQVFATFDEACAFMREEPALPLGWVAMQITLPTTQPAGAAVEAGALDQWTGIGELPDDTKDAALRYIRDWCPDFVKHYIDGLCQQRSAQVGVDDARLHRYRVVGQAYEEHRYYFPKQGYVDPLWIKTRVAEIEAALANPPAQEKEK